MIVNVRVRVGSPDGYADPLGGKDVGDEEADFLLVVVANGVPPVLFVFFSLVHSFKEPGLHVHRFSFLHLLHFEMQLRKGAVQFLDFPSQTLSYCPDKMMFLPILLCTNRLSVLWIIYKKTQQTNHNQTNNLRIRIYLQYKSNQLYLLHRLEGEALVSDIFAMEQILLHPLLETCLIEFNQQTILLHYCQLLLFDVLVYCHRHKVSKHPTLLLEHRQLPTFVAVLNNHSISIRKQPSLLLQQDQSSYFQILHQLRWLSRVLT